MSSANAASFMAEPGQVSSRPITTHGRQSYGGVLALLGCGRSGGAVLNVPRLSFLQLSLTTTSRTLDCSRLPGIHPGTRRGNNGRSRAERCRWRLQPECPKRTESGKHQNGHSNEAGRANRRSACADQIPPGKHQVGSANQTGPAKRRSDHFPHQTRPGNRPTGLCRCALHPIWLPGRQRRRLLRCLRQPGRGDH